MEKGRPSKFSQEVADKICARMATGESLRSICRSPEFPPESTVRTWAADDVHGFFAQYARARDVGLDAMADELLDIADTTTIGKRVTEKGDGTVETVTVDTVDRARLRVDTRKWYLSKLAPKRYGEKVQNEHSGSMAIHWPLPKSPLDD